MNRAASIAGNALFAMATAGLGLAILSLTVLPPVLHYQTYVVLSGSMEPTIHVGSVVVATAAAPDSLKIGDVVTYVRPGDQENVTHRIVGIKGTAGSRTFVTKGDASGAPDQGEIRYDRLAGKVQLTIPLVGYFFKFIGSPSMRFLFIVVPGLLLLGSWLYEVWKPEPKPKAPDTETPKGMAPPPMKPSSSKPTSSNSVTKNLDLGLSDAATVPLRR